MQEMIWIGLKELFSGKYVATFPLFFLILVGTICTIIGLILVLRFFLDMYIESKIDEHKEKCRRK